MDLTECLEKELIKKTKSNHSLIESLIEMSNLKEKVIKNSKIDEENISVFVSLAYDSLREALEALAIKIGYKILSHICLGELLKEKIEDFDYNEYDQIRYIRNGINYYGMKVDLKIGKKLIEKIFKMKREVIKNHLSVV